MCTLESETKDEELRADCMSAFAVLSQVLVQPDVIPSMLHNIKAVSTEPKDLCALVLSVQWFCMYIGSGKQLTQS
ncbi:hypothetical protein DPMN_099446 [Dreissena polymorpha]|uniref:Uncharacterized protein n=1 Tax=Dreissena polymorpha TaxID=45954 RepID=A0A9D4LEY5_DREPO|nr:hypothetical protein DPMN_099446 [Dreissena polymorpha]